uniref:Ribosomal protein S4 n=1 Tax=Oenanthe thomsonii TaxID=496680 RepID=A0AAN0LJ61_9APIA
MRYAVPALRFQTCRLLSGNVWNRELTIIQRRILRKLRNKKRSIKRKIYSRENLNSYIQSQTTRKLPLFHGDLPITEMHRGRERTSYIPFLLNPETRSDVIPVRLHFRETIPQARQPISHRKVCVNNGMVSITHFKVSRGDIISFQENDARARGEEIRRSFYIEISVEKIIGKFRDRPVRMWRRTKTEWFRLLKTKRGCRLLLKEDLFLFLQQLHSSMQEEDLERTKKFGSIKVCLGSSFAEHNRMKSNLYHFEPLVLSHRKRRNEKNRNLPTRTRSPIVYNPFFYGNDYYDYYDYDSDGNPYESTSYDSCSSSSSDSDSCSAPPHRFTMKRKIKRIELPTHYSEVNHRTLKAVVSYGPNIGHIPHDIRLKDPNLLLRSGNGRGQNI